MEQRVKPREAEPKGKAKPERPQPPAEKVKSEPPRTGGSRGTMEQRVKPREAEPKEKAKPERPQGTPAKKVRPEDGVQEEERGIRR